MYVSYSTSPAARSSFNPHLEGLRGIAALGVLSTHVAFQTGVDPHSIAGAILSRFDFFVAVFFALSAYLLWSPTRLHTDNIGAYYLRRAVRILPAYLVCVCVSLALVPETFHARPAAILTTLTFTQLYIPQGFIGGLTHLWSLNVEVAFYLLLPIFALLLIRLRPLFRIGCILTFSLLSLAWAFLPWVIAGTGTALPNRQIYPVAFSMWFAIGMIAAELVQHYSHASIFIQVTSILNRSRLLNWILAIGIAWLAGQEFFGPLGLTHPSPMQFVLRVLAGIMFAALILSPYLLPTSRSFLAHPIAQHLGKISYSLFLWHLPVLSAVFAVTGIAHFQGHFFIIWLLTTAAAIIVAWASYVWIEQPCRQALRGTRGMVKPDDFLIKES